MVLFKINGERNSGTIFLGQLLTFNFGSCVIAQETVNCITKYWKHGIPCSSIKQKDDVVVDICIVRNLNDWLVSMFKHPYHLAPRAKLDIFLTAKMKSIAYEKDWKTKRAVNIDDNDKTIFEIRYFKLKHYFDYFDNNDNVIFVNLEILQDRDRCIAFLSKINELYHLKDDNNFKMVDNHTKSQQVGVQNRSYNVDINKHTDIIEKAKDSEIEDMITNIFWVKHNNKKTIY